MVKNVNESRKDPERSTAAKARKPPPNPWPEIKRLQAALASAERTTERTRQASLDADARHQMAESGYLRRIGIMGDIIHDQSKLVAALSGPWYRRRDQERIDQLNARIFQAKNALAVSEPDAPGNILGLAVRAPTVAPPTGMLDVAQKRNPFVDPEGV